MIIAPKLIILIIAAAVAAAVIDAATINQQQQYSPIVSNINHHQSIIDNVQHHQQRQPIGEFMSENHRRSSTNSYDVAPQYFASNNFQSLANDQQMMMMNVDGVVVDQSIKNDNRLSSSSSPAAVLLKRYDMKKYLLKKILGNQHDLDDDDHDDHEGFFSQKHLKRHGTAGLAAKILGELIGIKIRESIENFGKSFSEAAKDFTARNFVSLGQLFGRLFQGPQSLSSSSSSSSIQSNQN